MKTKKDGKCDRKSELGRDVWCEERSKSANIICWPLKIPNKPIASEAERKISKRYLWNKMNCSGRPTVASGKGTSEIGLSHTWWKKLGYGKLERGT